MGKINKRIILILCVLLINVFGLKAQEQKAMLPLAEIFALLQKKYDVQFNYAEDIIKEISLTPPSEHFSLEESLKYLQENTSLTFTKLNANLILVSQKFPRTSSIALNDLTHRAKKWR